MDERAIVEYWLSKLCEKLDIMVLSDHEEWPEDFKNAVELAHMEMGLIDQMGTGFYWYTPEDEDVEYLFPLITKQKEYIRADGNGGQDEISNG